MAVPRPNDVWFSEDHVPLITQPYLLPDHHTTIITLPRSSSWRELYAVEIHGIASAVDVKPKIVTTKAYPGYDKNLIWRNGMIIPRHLIEFVISIQGKIELQTYDAVCRRLMHAVYNRYPLHTEEYATQDRWVHNCSIYEFTRASDFPSTRDLVTSLIHGDSELLM